MFYSGQLLSKGGVLQDIWFAAHADSKLKKQQVDAVSIPVKVDAIIAGANGDGDQLALRLSGQLLLGVTRVYSRKMTYLHQDCQAALGTMHNMGRDAAAAAAAEALEPDLGRDAPQTGRRLRAAAAAAAAGISAVLDDEEAFRGLLGSASSLEVAPRANLQIDLDADLHRLASQHDEVDRLGSQPLSELLVMSQGYSRSAAWEHHEDETFEVPEHFDFDLEEAEVVALTAPHPSDQLLSNSLRHSGTPQPGSHLTSSHPTTSHLTSPLSPSIQAPSSQHPTTYEHTSNGPTTSQHTAADPMPLDDGDMFDTPCDMHDMDIDAELALGMEEGLPPGNTSKHADQAPEGILSPPDTANTQKYSHDSDLPIQQVGASQGPAGTATQEYAPVTTEQVHSQQPTQELATTGDATPLLPPPLTPQPSLNEADLAAVEAGQELYAAAGVAGSTPYAGKQPAGAKAPRAHVQAASRIVDPPRGTQLANKDIRALLGNRLPILNASRLARRNKVVAGMADAFGRPHASLPGSLHLYLPTSPRQQGPDSTTATATTSPTMIATAMEAAGYSLPTDNLTLAVLGVRLLPVGLVPDLEGLYCRALGLQLLQPGSTDATNGRDAEVAAAGSAARARSKGAKKQRQEQEQEQQQQQQEPEQAQQDPAEGADQDQEGPASGAEVAQEVEQLDANGHLHEELAPAGPEEAALKGAEASDVASEGEAQHQECDLAEPTPDDVVDANGHMAGDAEDPAEQHDMEHEPAHQQGQDEKQHQEEEEEEDGEEGEEGEEEGVDYGSSDQLPGSSKRGASHNPISGLTQRTKAVLAQLEAMLGVGRPGKRRRGQAAQGQGSQALSSRQLFEQGTSRIHSAQRFYDLLVLQSRGFLLLKQPQPFQDLNLDAGPKMAAS